MCKEFCSVSVPTRGLFNLTKQLSILRLLLPQITVSVPTRGLFNLTLSLKQQIFTGSKIQKTAEITN